MHTLLILIACAGSALAQNQPAVSSSSPDVQDLGNQQYRIGEIHIDKADGIFRVPGKVLRDKAPLEFMVVTRGGHKAYESLLEVNADAYQFNLACILIGLDGSAAMHPDQRDFNQPAKGDPVEVTVKWIDGDKNRTVDAADLLVAGEPAQRIESRDWVYTGSVMLSEERYLADLSGTLIGFAHRGEEIIEHKLGIGVGKYGSVTVNPDITLPVGTAIELIIRRTGNDK
jgi:hypothetical protein